MKAKQREWLILIVGAAALITSLLLYFLQDPLSGFAWLKNAFLALAFALFVGYNWLSLQELKAAIAGLESDKQDLSQKLEKSQEEKARAERERQEAQKEQAATQEKLEEVEKKCRALEEKVGKGDDSEG
ncbi:MAG: hypothetical protein RI842_09870 [Schleiferiaceae bacterium]|nr:hypothetical protein [Schleiferiaceae bacterium]MDR9443015.1 hypothetical protein [Schleiferiaceae bacterium]